MSVSPCSSRRTLVSDAFLRRNVPPWEQIFLVYLQVRPGRFDAEISVARIFLAHAASIRVFSLFSRTKLERFLPQLRLKDTALRCLLRLGCFSVLNFYLPEPELVPAVGAAGGVGDSAGSLISMAQRGNA